MVSSIKTLVGIQDRSFYGVSGLRALLVGHWVGYFVVVVFQLFPPSAKKQDEQL